MGSVRNLVDNAGALIDTITYDGYGNIVSESNPSGGGQYKYVGYRLDRETGLYRPDPSTARYYSPKVGGWNGMDPIDFTAGDTNLYRYVRNNPTNFRDPFGLGDSVTVSLNRMLVEAGSDPVKLHELKTLLIQLGGYGALLAIVNSKLRELTPPANPPIQVPKQPPPITVPVAETAAAAAASVIAAAAIRVAEQAKIECKKKEKERLKECDKKREQDDLKCFNHYANDFQGMARCLERSMERMSECIRGNDHPNTPLILP
jgi:RHS repeat-associated protein